VFGADSDLRALLRTFPLLRDVKVVNVCCVQQFFLSISRDQGLAKLAFDRDEGKSIEKEGLLGV
jgi:hypothetical protein